MSINNYSTLARVVNHISNPNLQTGTLLEEIPADIGRSYQGYKRGGIIEGSEKLRKELISAIIWLFGIPFFNKIGNLFCEKILNIPMAIDYSNARKGNDAIKDSVEFLCNNKNNKNLNVDDLLKYGDKFKGQNIEELIKKVSKAKQITSCSALVLNCLLMGVVLPKINQAITRKKLKEQENKQTKNNDTICKFDSMKEFQNKTKKKDVSFTGLLDVVTYGVENNNKFRLIATDIPMIIGRMVTARNKYEALEIAFMDSASIYFYNFIAGNIQSLGRKLSKNPNINPIVAEFTQKISDSELTCAFEKLKDNKIIPINELFSKETADEIYKQATFGKFGKINKYIQSSELSEIDKNVNTFLKKLSKNKDIFNDGKIDSKMLAKEIRKINVKNGGLLATGLTAAAIGLGWLVPKMGYAITKKLTGQSGFIGIADIEKNNKKENC